MVKDHTDLRGSGIYLAASSRPEPYFRRRGDLPPAVVIGRSFAPPELRLLSGWRRRRWV